MIRNIVVALIIIFSVPVYAERLEKFPWKGNYVHNSTKTWSRNNPEDSGFSRNFMNGAPEELGKVQKDGDLWADSYRPRDTQGPIPFVILLHGCEKSDFTKVWIQTVAKQFNDQGIGLLAVDSFTSRNVLRVCGYPSFHWSRRRADDAYSALDYLIEKKMAIPDKVYLMGISNGGTATLIAMSEEESDHPNKFAAGFPIVSPCYNKPTLRDTYVRPMVLFNGGSDEVGKAIYCEQLVKKKHAIPMQLFIYKGANHGFMEDFPDRDMFGYTDKKGKDHRWALTYNKAANEHMMKTIISRIKSNAFLNGVEHR